MDSSPSPAFSLPHAEYERLRAEHQRLVFEHRELEGKPFDRTEHVLHKQRLGSHIEALQALRRAYEADWPLSRITANLG